MTHRKWIKILSVCLTATLLFGLTACRQTPTPGQTNNSDGYTPAALSAGTVDLMTDVTPASTASLTPDDTFIGSFADFAVKLFQQCSDSSQNTMISPLSVMLALSMTANGANGNTLAQMEQLLGGTLGIDTLNQYLNAYISGLPSSDRAKMSIADSIWFRNQEDTLTIQEDFLKTNASYYNADIYRSAFDEQTLADINAWVSDKTDGMITDILDEIPDEAVMYLINALAFDAEWKTIYNESQISDGIFTDADGTKQSVPMMHSSESQYLDDGRATGLIKPYVEGYSFAALLPNEGISIDEYVSSLTGASLIKTIQNAKSGTVTATIPKFKSEYSTEMSSILKSLGMTDAFSRTADFSKLGSSLNGNLYLSRILHKTFISVDEKGTEAGAATVVEVCNESAMESDLYTVTLDRPFVYAIIDNDTGLPLFIGVLMSAESP